MTMLIDTSITDAAEASTDTLPVDVTPAAPKKRKPRAKRHKYIAVNRLERSVGIETTFIPAFLDGSDENDLTSVNELCRTQVKMLKRRMDKAKVSYHRAHTDPNCVEVSTKPIQSRRNLRRTLAAYYELADGCGLISYNDWHRGCGAHIHVGRKKHETVNSDFIATFYADLSNRPYLTWAFMMYADDNLNAKPVAAMLQNVDRKQELGDNVERMTVRLDEARKSVIEAGKSRKTYTTSYRELRTLRLRDARRNLLDARKELAAYRPGKPTLAAAKQVVVANPYCLTSKSGCVPMRPYGKHGTLEFRFFRAPGSAEAHERQVNFALAYIEYIEGLVLSKKVPAFMSSTADKLYKEWTFERSKAEFIKTLRLIGLRPSEYAEDVENMRECFDHIRKKYPYLFADKPLEIKADTPSIPPHDLEYNQRRSRERRAARRAMAARKRQLAKLGTPAYYHISEVVLAVGDVVSYAYTYNGRIESIYNSTLVRVRPNGVIMDTNETGWYNNGISTDSDYTLVEVNGIPVTHDREPQYAPTTLAECEGAHRDAESGVFRGHINLKVGDTFKYMYHSRPCASTVTRIVPGHLPVRTTGDHAFRWNHDGTIDVDNCIIVEINGLPVIG